MVRVCIIFVIEWKLYERGDPKFKEAFLLSLPTLVVGPILGGRSARILGQMTLIVKLTNFLLQNLARLLSSTCLRSNTNELAHWTSSFRVIEKQLKTRFNTLVEHAKKLVRIL
jgi:hypothetical protein